MANEILKHEIKKLQKENNRICSKIHAKKLELAELEKEKKSAAEEWIKNVPVKFLMGGFTDIVIEAHEAGQAHATAATHEIYRPLLDKIQILYNVANHDGVSGHTKNLFDEFDNLKQPAQCIVGRVKDYTSSADGYVFRATLIIDDRVDIESGKKYKLTPID